MEINYLGAWGTICDDAWDIAEATVVCKQLGFTGALQALGGAFFGQGVDPIMLDDLSCEGHEGTLDTCDHIGWLINDCSHSEDASVRCDIEGML